MGLHTEVDIVSEYLPQYEEPKYFKNISDPDLNMTRAQWMLSRLSDRPNRVLELGAGRFTLTQAFRQLGVDAVGIDWSRTACGFAPDCAVRATMPNLPFRDRSFDLITAFDVLEHLERDDVNRAVREMHRVSSGYCLANIPLADPSPGDRHHLTMGDRPFWETIFRQCFEILDIGEFVPTFVCQSCLFLLRRRPEASALEVRV